MPSKRVIQAGHILALVFIALLLAGARGFLGAHSVLSGALLALVAPVYYVAARVSGHRQFLHPAALLATLGFQLVIYGAGVPFQYQPLVSLAPIALLFLLAIRAPLKRVEDASLSLFGAINFTIAAFSIWVLLRISEQFAHAPTTTAVALAAYALYASHRFLRTEKVAYVVAMVTLGSAAFLLLLYSSPAVALGLGAGAGLLVMADLSHRRMLPHLEAAAFTVVAAYLVFTALTGARTAQVPLGYLVLAGTWLHLGLVFHRPELPPLVGPHPAPLPRLLPLFGAGTVLALAPIVLFYPWQPLTVPVSYLAVFFVVFLATSRELAKQSFSLIGVVLARALALLARLAPLAALAFVTWQRFSPARLALAALALALLSLLAAWRVTPHILTRRNVYAYQAAAFATIAYFLAERQLALGGALGMLAHSGALLLLALLALGYGLRNRVAPALLTSLYEAAALPAAVACVLHVRTGDASVQAALLGVILIVACLLVFVRIRIPAVVFTIPVVLGLWIYVAEWRVGVRGEWLGTPYLLFGFLSAGVGYFLFSRRNHRWYQLFYFMWFLCAGVSVVLFAPLHAAGAYQAPLWAIVFLLIARGRGTRRDLPFALVLEAMSVVMAAAAVVVLAAQGLYLQTGVALVLYAAFYGWLALQRNLRAYLYPAAICLVTGYFFGVLSAGGQRLFLAYFLPGAAVIYLTAAVLRQQGQRQDARPLELAAGAGAILGALLFLTLPFGSHTVLGFAIGLGYLALYSTLTAYSGERVFFAGVGLAGAFAFYDFLPLVPAVTRGNRLAFFVPVSLLLVLLGRRQHRAHDPRGGWGLYTAAIIVTVLASVFAMWPTQPADAGASRVVLLIAIAVWPVLLVWTNNEIFIYGATLGLAMLAYHFVQNSTDMFGQHMMAFFLFGTVLVGLVFLAAAARNRLRFRRPTLLVPPKHWYARLLYLVPVVVLGVATFGSWGVSSSSNPHFCGTCHNMGTYFANWKSSKHASAQVSCASCHYDPGLSGYLRAKIKGTSQLVQTLTDSAARKPVAQVSNETCLRSGCHSTDQLAHPVMLRTIRFEHRGHLGVLARGPQLRCTSCHTSVDPDTHFAVDTNTCFTCHFHGALTNTTTAAGCVSCHALPQGKVAFDHVAAGVKPQDAACANCHERVVAGTAAVEPRQCRHCHIERAGQLMTASIGDIHARHVTGKGIGCDWCHGAVRHGGVDKQLATD